MVDEYWAGDVFGELACLAGTPHACTVVGCDMCSMYSLNRADIESVLSQWPDLKEELEHMGE